VLWLGWYFPRLPLEIFGAVDESIPLAVSRRWEGKERIDRCNGAARRRGIAAGMLLSRALERTPELVVRARDAEREREALEALGGWAWRYSSRITFDPLLVLLEVGGSLRLFGGVEAMLERMEGELTRLGHRGYWAVAPTPAAAALLARVAPGRRIHHPRALEAALEPVPMERFTRNAELLELMRQTGLRTIGDCLRLPRPELARRVGPRPALLLDRLLGRAPDPRPLWRPSARFRRRLQLAAEVEHAGALRFPARRLLESLAAFLRGRDGLVQRLEWTLEHRRHPPTRFRVGAAQPTRDPDRLLQLLQLRLERLCLPAPVIELELTVPRWHPFEAGGEDLFRAAGKEGERLLERLRTRLGAEAVRGMALRADPRPERAWRFCAPGGASTPSPSPHPAQRRQPLWLLPRPRRLRQRDGLPLHGGALRLEPRCQRIQTGWWEGEEVDRDYYRAVNPAGERLWIYRDRKSGDWFLHGFFD